MSEQQTAAGRGIRSFATLLSMIEDGQIHAELSKEVEELVAELQNAAGGHTATKGTISLSLALKYDPKTGMFEVGGDYKVAHPKAPRGRSIFWATPENALTLHNPKQQEMFMRDVNDSRGEARSV